MSWKEDEMCLYVFADIIYRTYDFVAKVRLVWLFPF